MSVDLSTPRSVHLIGIGGAGMAAIAEVLHGLGHTCLLYTSDAADE